MSVSPTPGIVYHLRSYTAMPSSTATNSLERALQLLRLVGQKPGGLSNAEISRRLDIPKSTCTYILTRLAREGYVIRDDSGRYKVGLKTLALAQNALHGIRFRTVTEPVLYRLAKQTGLAASSGVLNRGKVLLVDRVESPEFIKHAVELGERSAKTGVSPRQGPSQYVLREQRDIGRELPALPTALGRVLLSHLPRHQMVEFVREHPVAKYTPRTIVSETELIEQLDLVRRQGYSTVDDEYYVGICALSAPIFDSNKDVSAAISVSGDRALRVWQDPRELIERVRAASLEISKKLKD
jgi:IclR family KDG regulon transcriptional repressor